LIFGSILEQVVLWLKLAQCHTAVESNVDAIRVYQKGMSSVSEQPSEAVFVVFVVYSLSLNLYHHLSLDKF